MKQVRKRKESSSQPIGKAVLNAVLQLRNSSINPLKKTIRKSIIALVVSIIVSKYLRMIPKIGIFTFSRTRDKKLAGKIKQEY